MSKILLITTLLVSTCLCTHNPLYKKAKSNLQNEIPCPMYPETVPLYVDGELPTVVQTALNNLDKFLASQQKSLQLPGNIIDASKLNRSIGLVCSVVYDQGIIWHGEYGYNNPFNKSEGPPTLDSMYSLPQNTVSHYQNSNCIHHKSFHVPLLVPSTRPRNRQLGRPSRLLSPKCNYHQLIIFKN
jgi:hypothetical protein